MKFSNHRNYSALIFCIIVLISMSGCFREEGDKGIIADNKAPSIADIETLSSSIKLIPVPKECMIGNIMYSKSYGDMIFLFDEGLRKIHCFENGTPCFTLDKVGRGPEDYIGIGAFTYIQDSRELVIFEREKRLLKYYSIDSGGLQRKMEIPFYANAMEYLKDGEFLFIRETDKQGNTPAVCLYSTYEGTVRTILPLRDDQAEMTTDFSFTKKCDSVFFGISSYSTALYSFRANLTEEKTIYFESNALDKNYWSGEFDERKEEILTNAIASGKDFALAPSFLNTNKTALSFWYINAMGQAHSTPPMNLCIIDKSEAVVYSNVRCLSLGVQNLQPIGVYGSGYVSLLFLDMIKPKQGTTLGDDVLRMREMGLDMALMVYEL